MGSHLFAFLLTAHGDVAWRREIFLGSVEPHGPACCKICKWRPIPLPGQCICLFFESVYKAECPSFLGDMHTGQQRPVTETPMFAPQLLWIYHLVIRLSHHDLSLGSLRPSQHDHSGVIGPQNRSTRPLYSLLSITSQQDV